MRIFKNIFSLSKKTSESILYDEELVDLEKTELFSSKDKEDIINSIPRILDDRQKINKEINIDLEWKNIQNKISYPRKGNYLNKFTLIAAAFISIIFLSIEVFKSTSLNDTKIETEVVNAILTQEKGQQISIKEGTTYQLSNSISNGKRISYKPNLLKTNKTTYNYLETPRGGEFYIELTDGTKIWLNSETKIKYPTQFNKKQERKVELLYGEAYFEVSSNTEKTSFKVVSHIQEIKVLGTKFNVKAFKDDDDITTTLIEGKIQLKNSKEIRTLIPNQQAKILKNSEKFTVADSIDLYNVISWKEGLFRFKNTQLNDMTKVLSRWFNIEFQFQTENLKTIKFTGAINKKEKIQKILDIIKKTNKVNYDIKNDGNLVVFK